MQIPTFVNWIRETEIEQRFVSAAENYNEYSTLIIIDLARSRFSLSVKSPNRTNLER